jgi:hypothetical protein
MRATMTVLLGIVLGAAAANAAVSVSARRAVKCAEAKIRAVRRKTDAKLTCQAIAVRRRTAVNPLCIASAEAAFLTAFARAEAKGGCFNPNGESETRSEGRVNEFIADIGSLLIPCSPQGSTCGASDCSGRLPLCVSDVSSAPVCADTSNCRQTCTSDAMCDSGSACVSVFAGGRCCDICE